MKIIETGLSFGSMSVRKKTNRIIVHHAAAKTASASDIHRWHKQRGWSGAGYHFLVRKDGSIYRLRPEKYVGAHASGSNSDSLGICFEGDFEKETMGTTQKNAGKELVAYLKKLHGISKVQRHKDVGSTSCPGKNFPFSEIAGASGNVTVSTGSAANSAEKPSVSGKSYKVKINTKSGVNVRKGPGTGYDILTAIPNGTTVTITKESGDWGYTTYAGKKGYISLKYAKKVSGGSSSSGSSSSGSTGYKVGNTYTTQVELKVRTGAGTNYRMKKRSELTADGRKHDKDGDACLDKGTRITCQQVKKDGSDVWIKCPSGWIAAKYQGKTYVK